MLEPDLIQKLAKDIQIAPEHIAREIYEMLILQTLTQTPLTEKLVFKGGTALRLVHNSPRFSEDLDFSLLSKISLKDLDQVLKKLEQQFPEITITDISDKYYTHFALLKIKEDFLAQAFSIKVEISKRLFKPSCKPGYQLSSIESPCTPLGAFGNVMTPEEIFSDKTKAVQTRLKPQDVFDLWFLSEKLKKPVPVKIKGFSASMIKQELNKFLPRKYYYVVKVLSQKYANNRHSKTTKKNK